MPPCGAAVFAFRQSIGRSVDIGERPLCGTPVISRSRPGAVLLGCWPSDRFHRHKADIHIES